MILITSAAYCSDDFTLEFGKIPPSFLPLGNRRLYEFQANLFQNIRTNGEKIALSLPRDFALNRYDSDKLSRLGIEILRVPGGLSLGASIVFCVNLALEKNEPLFILHGDTYFQKISLKPDTISVTSVSENYKWAYLNENFRLKNAKIAPNLILAGAYNFSSAQLLIKKIVQNDYDFVAAMANYSQIRPLNAHKNDTWLDFGLITSYFHSKKVVTTERAFNQIAIKSGFVRKTSAKKEKLKGEIFWFENLPPNLLIFTPRFLGQKNGYAVEYLYNNTLAELLVFGHLPAFSWRRIFLGVREFLKIAGGVKFGGENGENAPNFNYAQKTRERLNELAKTSDLDPNKRYKINGKIAPSAFELVEILEKILGEKPLENNEFCFIHGDFCFSNIMFDFRAGQIKTYDPRGVDFGGRIGVFGDPRYDMAKLIHSVFGLYDFIIAGFFECVIKGDAIDLRLENDENIKEIGREFLKIFAPGREIFAICVHLFLSMPPLHSDNKPRQIALFANAFRLFWLFFGENFGGENSAKIQTKKGQK